VLVMVAIAVVCVLGVVGALASTLSYDQLYGQEPRGYEPPSRPVRRRRSRRRSRQLRAVEAALAADTPAAASTPELLADTKAIKLDPRTQRP
jgi:hypothetical protein